MEIILSCICSVIVSVVIGNIVGRYYLKYNDKKWEETFNKITQVTIEEVRKLKNKVHIILCIL